MCGILSGQTMWRILHGEERYSMEKKDTPWRRKDGGGGGRERETERNKQKRYVCVGWVCGWVGVGMGVGS